LGSGFEKGLINLRPTIHALIRIHFKSTLSYSLLTHREVNAEVSYTVPAYFVPLRTTKLSLLEMFSFVLSFQ